ncbi:MAG: carboxypeptidase-like regulatory domain-containing protein, partial [Gemmatimonadota bacterium]|nr:carboxypeptidase-like regulatory domain-containing protein [Gemmatimonadota bacterium]
MSKMAKLMCLWATLGYGVAWAQSDGFIEGTVTEEAGESLPGANIAVRLPTADYKAGTTADSDGQFRIAVPAGNCQVEITFVGYKSDLRENVQVRAGQTTRLDVVLVEQVIFLA